MKYTLNTYGWSAEFIGKRLNDTQVEVINKILDEKGIKDLSEIRFELPELVPGDEYDFDIWDGDILQMVKPLDNDTMFFQLLDENDEKVLEFGIEDIKSVEIDDENTEFIQFYDITGGEDGATYSSIDEFKGGIFSYEIEAEEQPTVEDFTYLTKFVETPEGDWDIIDEIYFKGEKLEMYDFLDNTGKAATVQIY